METAYFSELATDAIQTSGKLAVQFKYDCIVPEHLLLAIIDESLRNPEKSDALLKTFKQIKINVFELIEDIEASFDKTKWATVTGKIPFSDRTSYILKLSFLEAKKTGSYIIQVEHLLLSYLKHNSPDIGEILSSKYKLTYEIVKGNLAQ